MKWMSRLQEWGGESLLVRHDRETGSWMFIALYAHHYGVAAGGTRFKPYPTPQEALDDALRLAEAMDRKFLIMDVPRDGGKGVIAPPPHLTKRERQGVLRRYGDWISAWGGRFETAADVGTTQQDMLLLAARGCRVFGRPVSHGGMGRQGPPTALGVFLGMKEACRAVFGTPELDKRTVLVQGAGEVGRALIELLLQAGARVLVSEPDRRRREQLSGKKVVFVPPEEALEHPCEVLAPCAVGGVLTQKTIPRLRCALVAGSANNQLGAPRDAELLHQRDILFVPDYVLNSGAVLYGMARELEGLSESQARDRLRRIPETLREILQRARSQGCTPWQVAEKMVEEKRRGLRSKRPRPSPGGGAEEDPAGGIRDAR